MKTLAFDPMLNCADAAKYLCIHPRELRRMVVLREIGSVRRGPQGHIKIRLSELNRWADQHTTRAKRAKLKRTLGSGPPRPSWPRLRRAFFVVPCLAGRSLAVCQPAPRSVFRTQLPPCDRSQLLAGFTARRFPKYFSTSSSSWGGQCGKLSPMACSVMARVFQGPVGKISLRTHRQFFPQARHCPPLGNAAGVGVTLARNKLRLARVIPTDRHRCRVSITAATSGHADTEVSLDRLQGWQPGVALARVDGFKPRLESWNEKDHKDRVRLRQYLAEVEVALGPWPRRRLYLHLDVDVLKKSNVERHHDLENYLTPLVRHLGPESKCFRRYLKEARHE